MVECQQYGDFSLDGYLHSNLNIVLEEAIPNNWDCVYILFGREGTGKTTLGTQISWFLDNTFGVTKIVWTPDQFDQAIDNAEVGDSILWDEAITGAMSTQHAEEVSMRIVKKLTMIRKKKLKIGICFPYLYMLNKYFVSRCLFSIYIYAKGFGDRGYARFYDSRNTEKLYELMKGKYRYDYAGAFSEATKNFHFRFTSRFCADVGEYDRLKTESSKLIEANTKEEEFKNKWIKTMAFGNKIHKGFITQLSKYFGFSGNSYLFQLISNNKHLLTDKDNMNLIKENEDILKTNEDLENNDNEIEQVKPKPVGTIKQNNKGKKNNKEKVYKENRKINKDVDIKEDINNEEFTNGIYLPDEHKALIDKRLREDGRFLNPTE